jgi:acetate kinase
MNVLVLNVGSSTLKFELIGTDGQRIEANDDARLAGGAVERIGGEAVMSLSVRGGPPTRAVAPLRNLAAAVEYVASWLVSEEADVGISSLAEIEAVGHRVVHGGEQFARSQRVDDKVMAALEELVDLAPLHNPHNVAGMRAASRVFGPGVPQVAVFDTAFHSTLPETAFLYGLPYQLYRRYKVRRYGFHGTSHRSVAHRYRQITGRTRESSKLITLHLGNGASACAIRGGDSVDTSMGFTPLEGLVMGTRSGDLDPAILDFITSKEGLTLPQVEVMLNKQSGLLGLSGLTADMRELRRRSRSMTTVARGSPSMCSAIAPANTSAPTSRSWTARMRSCSPVASARTRSTCARASVPTSSGSAFVSMRPPTPRSPAAAKAASTPPAAAWSCG